LFINSTLARTGFSIVFLIIPRIIFFIPKWHSLKIYLELGLNSVV
jgi:hypothetical protein